MTPDASTTPPPARAKSDSALLKALANAHRWQRMLESGEYATVGGSAGGVKVKSAASDSTTTIALGSCYGHRSHLMRADPATSVAWTKAGVVALQSLIEVA